jgi:hypothetical protein
MDKPSAALDQQEDPLFLQVLSDVTRDQLNEHHPRSTYLRLLSEHGMPPKSPLCRKASEARLRLLQLQRSNLTGVSHTFEGAIRAVTTQLVWGESAFLNVGSCEVSMVRRMPISLAIVVMPEMKSLLRSVVRENNHFRRRIVSF